MKLSDSDQHMATANGDGNGAIVATNGHAASSSHLHNRPLFESSTIDRSEFVRLMVQAMRDVGYSCVPLRPQFRAL